MKSYQTLQDILPALNDMLLRERVAITLLDLEALTKVQEEKGALLAAFQEIRLEGCPSLEPLVSEVQSNNERNQHLLRSSMKLFGRMRERLLSRMAPTYKASGAGALPTRKARLLAGSV